MTGKEYYKKYRDGLSAIIPYAQATDNGIASEKADVDAAVEKVADAINGLFMDMNHEMQMLIEVRQIKMTHSMFPIIKEMNQKYNIVCREMIKEFGTASIKENGYLKYILDTIPEIRKVAQFDESFRRYIDEHTC